jgi:hypothetical protein
MPEVCAIRVHDVETVGSIEHDTGSPRYCGRGAPVLDSSTPIERERARAGATSVRLAVEPITVFALGKEKGFSATLWRFG